MTKLTIIRGYPGSGKTTLGKILQDNGFGVFIDHNKILTFVASIAGDDEGIYENIADLEQAMTRKLLNSGKDVIVARGFSSKTSVADYQEIAEEAHAVYVILRLEASEQLLSERVQSPERQKDFNPTISPSALSAWIKDNSIEDVAVEYVVNADKSIDEVFDQACSFIKLST